MRVLILSKRIYTAKDLILDRYGRVFEFSRALASNGHDVRGVAFDYRRAQPLTDSGYLPQRIIEANLEWETERLYSWPAAGIRRYLAKVAQLAVDFRPDIILSASDVYHVLAGDWLARKFGLIHVADLYDNYESFTAARAPGIVYLFRRAVARSAGIICVSQPLAQYVHDSIDPKGSISVIGNAVDKTQFTLQDCRDCRRHFGLPEGKKLAGIGGAISSERGIQTVFDTHKLLLEGGNEIHLVLAGPVGKGVEVPKGEFLHYLGELDYAEMPLFYGALDVGIIANKASDFGRYCFPQKFFEMLSCGRPMAVAATGEVRELMKGCKHALFQPEMVKDMSRAILKQLEAPCMPVVEIPSWAQQGALLSSYLEKIVCG